jgi:hypothetical protein
MHLEKRVSANKQLSCMNEELRIDIGEPEIEDDVISIEISMTITRTCILEDADSVTSTNGKSGQLSATNAPGRRSSP